MRGSFAPAAPVGPAELSDEELVARIRTGETGLYEVILRRHNRRIYRVVRAVLRNEHEAEDVMQEAYVRAYEHLGQFEGRATFSTWLTRIALHEALARVRGRSRFEPLGSEEQSDPSANPEREAARAEVQQSIEAAIDALPEPYRTIFMLREVEELSPAETAQCLGISESLVSTRLHRARVLLRRSVPAPGLFPFPAVRCDRVVAAVFARLSEFAQSTVPRTEP